jgi:hypothetical protein
LVKTDVANMSLHDLSVADLTLVDKTALDDPECNEDLIFTQEQFQNLNYQVKRRLAAITSTGEINGKSDSMQMESYFVRQHTLDEFE